MMVEHGRLSKDQGSTRSVLCRVNEQVGPPARRVVWRNSRSIETAVKLKGLRPISMSSLNLFKKEICMSHQKRLVVAVALIASLLFSSLPAMAQTSSTSDWTSLQRLAPDTK